MNKIKFFVGVECEGIYKGLYTLFVVKDQKSEDILKIIDENASIKQIYFGAFHQSKIHKWNTIRDIHDVLIGKNIVITIEVDLSRCNIPDDILYNLGYHKILTTKAIKKSFKNITLKIENEDGIFCFHDVIFNDYSQYKNDTIIGKKEKSNVVPSST